AGGGPGARRDRRRRGHRPRAARGRPGAHRPARRGRLARAGHHRHDHPDGGGSMTASVLAVEIRDELYAIIREPTAVFFSIAMPVGMFAVFASLFGTAGDGPVSGTTLMLATFGAFGVISVSLTPGIGIAEDRERGWLRVKRVSPVPVRTTLAAKVAASLPVAFGVYAAMSLTAVAMGRFDTDLGTWLLIAGL